MSASIHHFKSAEKDIPKDIKNTFGEGGICVAEVY